MNAKTANFSSELSALKSDVLALVGLAESISRRVQKLESLVERRKRPHPSEFDSDVFSEEESAIQPKAVKIERQVSVSKTPSLGAVGSGSSISVDAKPVPRDKIFSPPSVSTGKNFEYDNERIVVHTDGSCFNNGKSNAKAGIGVYWFDGCSYNVADPLPGKQSNNRAELQAAVAAIRLARKQGFKKIQLRTDSGYVKTGITSWILKWKKNGWKTATNNPVKNVEDWQELDSVQQLVDVEWKWVEAHKGIHGNEMADRLANDGARKH